MIHFWTISQKESFVFKSLAINFCRIQHVLNPSPQWHIFENVCIISIHIFKDVSNLKTFVTYKIPSNTYKIPSSKLIQENIDQGR